LSLQPYNLISCILKIYNRAFVLQQFSLQFVNLLLEYKSGK
jgi:hypothetical protein